MKTALILSALPLTTLLTLITGAIGVPALRKFKLGQHIREEGPESHLSKGGTPTMGGIFFLIPALLVTLLLSEPSWHVAVLILSVLLIAGLGMIDDLQKILLKNNKGITPKQKLLGQVLIGGLLGAYFQFGPPAHLPYTEIPFFNYDLYLGWAFIPFIAFFYTATTNAVNLTDGLDGLAASVTVACLSGLCVLLALQNGWQSASHQTLLILGLSTIGGCLGFLWFNAHPAQVFMGDTGSLGLGGVICILALAGHLEFWFVMVGLIYVLEALSVVIQVSYYKRTKKRIFKMSPLHHHFELDGWKETQVVQRFSIVSVLMSSLAILIFCLSHGYVL